MTRRALVEFDIVALVVVVFKELFEPPRLLRLVRLAFFLAVLLLLVISRFLAFTRLPLSQQLRTSMQPFYSHN